MADGRIVSNIPIENTRQTYGNLISPYICRGVFTNSTFTYRYGDSYSIQIDISAIKQFSHDLILFEFGIFNGAVERQILEGPIFSVFLWMEFYVLKKRGCCIVHSEGQLIQYKTFLVLDPESKQFQYQT